MKKSATISGMNFGTEVLNSLYKAVMEIGGTEEDMFEKLKTGSPLFEKWAHDIIEVVPKLLTMIKTGIEVATGAFEKALFGSENERYHIFESFQNMILNHAPEQIHSLVGKVNRARFNKDVHDSAIIAEIGESNIFPIEEALAILKSLTYGQKAEEGDLAIDGTANIIFVRLGNGSVVVASARWGRDTHVWCLYASQFGRSGPWYGNYSVITRG